MGLGISLLVSIFNRTGIFCRTYPTWFGDKTWPDEVRILNDGGDEDLEEAVKLMACEYLGPIYYTYRDKGHERWSNPAIPHNYLVKQAKYPIVLIIDPEIAFVTDGLPMIEKFYQDETHRSSSCSACGTYSLQRNLGPLSIEQIINHPHTTDPTNPDRLDIIFRPGTPTKGYRAWWRQRYIDLGGKDERYIGWGYDDLDLHYRQRRLPPEGADYCAKEISVVEFLHPTPGMVGSDISMNIWAKDGSRGIPEDGVANRGKEWGKIEIREEHIWE